MKPTESFAYVIFGATGDLTHRKLIPALFSLFEQGLLGEHFFILGMARSPLTDTIFREKIKSSLLNFAEKKPSIDSMQVFLEKLYYLPFDFHDASACKILQEHLLRLRKKHSVDGNTMFYMATPPALFETIPVCLSENGLNQEHDGWKRIIIEKPFGYDYTSAVRLKDLLLRNWKEEQIYRIDHYLGKETVQNLLVTRFSNGIFEPLWNRNYIHHVEITSAESIGIEKRGGYYENAGALRDMIQNHLLQLAAITAMEPPSSMEPQAIRNEILKVLQSLRPIAEDQVENMTIRGQYLSSVIKHQAVKGYREEEAVNPSSATETYAALKFYIDNWRWGGVPFYIRTGKRLPTRVTEVVIHFKPTPHFLFSEKETCRSCNQLVIRIQPDEGILLKFSMKTPGTGFDLQSVNMDFHYADLGEIRIPNAYERLIYDSLNGDSTLFSRTEEVLEAWKFLSPVLEKWNSDQKIPLYGYPAGTWGPEKADNLIEEDAMTWRYPCKNLADDGIYCEL